MYKKIFIFGIFSLFVNINFLASEEIPIYKLIFLGDEQVGKSCIIERFVKGTFTEEYQSTTSIDSYFKDDQIGNKNIKLLLYDTSGQEKFRSLIPIYTKNADIILLVYDVTSKNSFTHLSDWLNFLTGKGIDIKKEDVIFAVVGNKTDIVDKREVSAELGKAFAEKNGFIFEEVSAATGDGIKELFDVIRKEMLKKKPELLQPQPEIIKIQKSGGKIKPEGGKKVCCCC